MLNHFRVINGGRKNHGGCGAVSLHIDLDMVDKQLRWVTAFCSPKDSFSRKEARKVIQEKITKGDMSRLILSDSLMQKIMLSGGVRVYILDYLFDHGNIPTWYKKFYILLMSGR
jgi:hypothetical protein